ncbi:MAG: cellulose biosynthesis protein BcsG [Hydrogenophaga sp.]
MSWHIYFVSKLFLAAHERLQLEAWLNFPLALLVYWPIAQRPWRWVRALLAWPAALALAAHEVGTSIGPRLIQQLSQLTEFSQSYALELGLRLLQDGFLPSLLALLLVSLWLNRWFRLDVLLCLSLLVLPLAASQRHAVQADSSMLNAGEAGPQNGANFDPQARVQNFWRDEQQRAYPFVQGERPPFDVVLLHVCSLSWDDLDAIGLGRSALFDRFDLVFEQFNSVSSYSGPSMLRLLRANCGQTHHEDLYRPEDARCGLLRQLTLAGYQVQAYLNHDGRFDGFADSLADETSVPVHTPVRLPGAQVALQAFDGSPIGGDHATLAAWRSGVSSSTLPQALYYNTVTLHDGNRQPGGPAMEMADSYRLRLGHLMSDLDRFIGDIELSKRPTLVALLPEHGAALRKGAQPIAGLRETPWPEITLVPVAVKLIGLDSLRPSGLQSPVRVSGPTSYLSFAALLAELLSKPDPWDVLRTAPQNLPRVPFVSDNGDSIVTLDEKAMWIRTASRGWQHLERLQKYSQLAHQEHP